MYKAISKNAAPLLFLAVVLIGYFLPVLFLDNTFYFRDVMKFGIPEKWFQLQMYQQGALPFWNPHIYNGVPFLPLLHPNPTYPGNILLFVGEFPYGYNLFLVAHHALLVVSIYFLVRNWGLSRSSATASSLVVLLGGYFLSLVSLGNQLISTAWMPLILLCVQNTLRGKGKGWMFAALACWVMQILGGSPESCAMSTLVVLGAAVFITTGNRAEWQRPIVVVTALVAVALGLTAFQLIPTYFVVQQSVRSWDLNVDFHTVWSLQPEALWTLFFHHNFDIFMEGPMTKAVPYLPSIYMGILPACMALLAPVFIKRREVKFWAVVFWLGIFLALGKHNVFYTSMLEFNPLLKMFRFPEKFIFLSAFSMVFLTAYWWEAFIQKPKRAGMLPWAMAFLIFASLMLGGSVFAPKELVLVQPFIWFSIFAGVFLLSLSGKIQRPNLIPSVMLFLLFMDLWNAHSRLIPFIDEQLYKRPPEVKQALLQDPTPFRVYSGEIGDAYRSNDMFPKAPNFILSHLLEKKMAIPNLGTIFDLDYADGVMSIETESIWIWKEMFKKSPPEKRKRMLERGNVRYQIVSGNSDPWADTGPAQVVPLDGTLPRAFLVPRYRLGPEVKLLNTYFSETFDPLQEVLLDKPVSFEASPDFVGEVEGILYRPNRVEVYTRQVGSGFLVLLDSYFPGWTVRVDGLEATLLRANHFYRAVQLGPGNHRIEFKYVPEGFILGKTISGVTLFLVLALMAAILFRKQPATSPGTGFNMADQDARSVLSQ